MNSTTVSWKREVKVDSNLGFISNYSSGMHYSIQIDISHQF